MKAGNYPAMAEVTYRSSSSVAREVELVKRVAEGDRRAFEELYNLYHVLNHANLFGGGYARQASEAIDRLLAAVR